MATAAKLNYFSCFAKGWNVEPTRYKYDVEASIVFELTTVRESLV